MKYLRFLTTLLLILFLASSCDDAKEKKLIIGQWTGTEWLVMGRASDYNPASASFTFDDNGKYTFSYGDNMESGKYFLSNNELFTTPEGGIKMMVRIPKITQDSMIMDMNRGGQSEQLTLVRVK